MEVYGLFGNRRGREDTTYHPVGEPEGEPPTLSHLYAVGWKREIWGNERGGNT